MFKIYLVGSEALVAQVPDPASLKATLGDPNAVLEVVYDGKAVLIPVRAVAAIVALG